jgi:mono/diheme cytochrome c family protein
MKLWVTLFSITLLLAANLALGQSDGELVKQGQEVYEANCADCHRSNGEGLPVKFPALKGNAFVTGDPKPVIATVLNGLKGNLGQMPAWKDFLNDLQAAAVVSYIRQAWSNRAPAVTPAMVADTRGK